MSTPFRVELDDLDDLIARINGLAGFIRDELDELDRRAAALIGPGWEGPAAHAYADSHNQWSYAASAFVEHVHRMEALTRKAHDGYLSATDMNTHMLRTQP
ncbi:WXG100 family type VII secretion target [Rhodococcus sp. 1168]|uniref:WXG100 family type VII secretion target n=1 Tax=Rhodococcus sp. 1168 TaxID=2018041 RepID=UPI000A0D5AB1|nr:WXG100 family type VII secretion target [Rhodococcus sp. 1168]ORI21108.1 hypothetical protein BJI47_16800 [Rhodococcus sp. 1168]